MDSQKRYQTSVILKVTVILSAVIGTIISALAGKDEFMGGTKVFMYFTIQSNLALALICGIGLWLLITKKTVRMYWWIIKFIGTVSITLTGMVFCFVLAPTMGILAWNFQNILTHVVVPVASVADFFLATEKPLSKKAAFLVIIPPIIYAVYAGIGYVLNWEFAVGYNYPYFFLNWGSPAGAFGFSNELPFMGCAWWILALMIFLILVGYLYLYILSRVIKKREK